MKTKLLIYCIGIAIVIVGNLSAADIMIEEEYPYAYITRENPSLAKTLGQIDDMRMIYCDYKVLENRIQRKEVALEMRGMLLNGKNDVPSKVVRLVGGISMREFLDMSGLKAWQGGQPQIKLIKQNLILQSPFNGNNTKVKRAEHLKAFLTSKVEPGDMVVVTRIR